MTGVPAIRYARGIIPTMPRLTRKEFLTLGTVPFLPRFSFGQPGGRPKNILLLMSDQHRPHALGVDGDPVARTPNLDALARSAVRFDSAYCSNPVCVPSRASLLTGLYTHNHGALNNAIPWPFEQKTIAHHLGRAGYMTGLIGKMHFVDAQTHGFDYHLDFNDWYQYLGPKTKLYADELGRANSGSGMPQIDDLWRDSGDPWKGARDAWTTAQGFVHVGRVSKMPEQDHFESFVARESIRFLKNHGRRQPFFLISSFLKPHDPFMPAERFAEMFRPEDMKLPDTWGKVDLATVPKEIADSIRKNSPTPEVAGRSRGPPADRVLLRQPGPDGRLPGQGAGGPAGAGSGEGHDRPLHGRSRRDAGRARAVAEVRVLRAVGRGAADCARARPDGRRFPFENAGQPGTGYAHAARTVSHRRATRIWTARASYRT